MSEPDYFLAKKKPLTKDIGYFELEYYPKDDAACIVERYKR